jgi:hypothetical protein
MAQAILSGGQPSSSVGSSLGALRGPLAVLFEEKDEPVGIDDHHPVRSWAVYFTEYDGRRGAIMIVDVADPSKVPTLAEPWFLSFNADVTFHIVMNPEELGRAGLDAIGKKWA